MRKVAATGKIGEIKAGIKGYKPIIDSLSKTAKFRRPDGINRDLKILIEVKNYKGILSYTKQIHDYVLYAQDQGYKIYLYTNAELSGPLQQIVDSGLIKIIPLS